MLSRMWMQVMKEFLSLRSQYLNWALFFSVTDGFCVSFVSRVCGHKSHTKLNLLNSKFKIRIRCQHRKWNSRASSTVEISESNFLLLAVPENMANHLYYPKDFHQKNSSDDIIQKQSCFKHTEYIVQRNIQRRTDRISTLKRILLKILWQDDNSYLRCNGISCEHEKWIKYRLL